MTSAVAAQVKGSGTWKEKQARSHNLIVHMRSCCQLFFLGMEQVWHALPKTHTAIVAPPPRISVFHPLCCVESTMCASLTMLKHLFEPLTLRTSAEVKDVTALYNTLGEELITGGVSVIVKLWKQIHLSGQYVLFFSKLLLRLSIFRWEVNLLWWITLIVSFGCHLHSIF